LRNNDETVWVTVEDNGRGLDPKTANAIFEPFVSTKTHSMGLGLAICRMIVERHGGQLSAKPAETRGAVFLITMPQAKLNQLAPISDLDVA
jgi:signal transduction histidine kinase